MSFENHLTQDIEIWRLQSGLDSDGMPVTEFLKLSDTKGLIQPLRQAITDKGRIVADSKLYLNIVDVKTGDKIKQGDTFYSVWSPYNVHNVGKFFTVAIKRDDEI